MTTPVTGMPELNLQDSSKEVTHNEALRIIDVLQQLSVISESTTALPAVASAADGDAYIRPAGGTGAWASEAEGVIAYLHSNSWEFITPKLGWLAWVQDVGALYVYDPDASQVWSPFDPAIGSYQPLDGALTFLSGAATDDAPGVASLIGVGTEDSPTFAGLTLTGTLTQSGTITTAGAFGVSYSPTIASSVTTTQYGQRGLVSFTPSGASLSAVIGGEFGPVIASTAFTISSLTGVTTRNYLGAGFSGTVTTSTGVQVVAPQVSGGSITNSMGVDVQDTTASTSVRGIRLRTTAGTGKHCVYADGTAPNYMAGNLGIGQTTATAVLHLKAGTAAASTAPIKLTSGTNLTTPENGSFEYDGTQLFFTRTGAAREQVMTSGNMIESIMIACSDETTPLTAGTAKITFRMPYAFTLTAVRASLTTAQATDGAGGIFTVDINDSGTTILSTKLTIDNTETTSTTAATPAVISDTALADAAVVTIDIDQIGDGTATGLKVYLIGRQTI